MCDIDDFGAHFHAIHFFVVSPKMPERAEIAVVEVGLPFSFCEQGSSRGCTTTTDLADSHATLSADLGVKKEGENA